MDGKPVELTAQELRALRAEGHRPSAELVPEKREDASGNVRPDPAPLTLASAPELVSEHLSDDESELDL